PGLTGGRGDRLAGQKGDVVAELAQQPGEEAVQPVAEAAAATDDDLVEKRLWLDREPPADDDVEVLEGHRVEVGEREAGERVQRGGGGPLAPDPLQIVG